jgi:hypothetical protein
VEVKKEGSKGYDDLQFLVLVSVYITHRVICDDILLDL